MLTIQVPALDLWDDDANRFVTTKPITVQLEHSLISLTKWESKHKKAFLSQKHDQDELLDYIKCMTVTQGVSRFVYSNFFLTNADALDQIAKYIDDPMTATTFALEKAGDRYNPKRSVITSEIIYYWMVSFGIPFDCQRWHLNRLLTLIRVCAIKSQPPKKMSKREVMERNRRLNEQRRAATGSSG